MLYDVEFKELFDNERQAVVCYLSLVRRYTELCMYLKDISKEMDKIIDVGYVNYQRMKE